jgi:hypothetical protein
MRERKAVRMEDGSGTSQVNGDAVGVGAVTGRRAGVSLGDEGNSRADAAVAGGGGGTAPFPPIEENAGGGESDWEGGVVVPGNEEAV